MKSISIIKHTIKNHSGFAGEHTIGLVPNKTNVIFGINGAGKTSLLNAFYGTILGCFSTILSDNETLNIFNKNAINLNTTESKFISNFEIDEKSYQIDMINSLDKNFTRLNKFRDYEQTISIIKTAISNQNNFLPIIRFFRSEKLVDSRKSIVTSKEYNEIERRIEGYNQHTSQYLSIQEVTSFLIDQINIENKEKINRKDFDYTTPIASYVRETLDLFTDTLYNQKTQLDIGASKYSTGQTITIQKQDSTLEFTQLSSGEKYVFAMVLELIYRNVLLNSKVKNLRDVPGIVLIDEIEDHLHPRWQLTIIKALETAFPKVQFIASSHSDLIATSVKKEQIIVLDNFEIIPQENLKDVYSGTANEALIHILGADKEIPDFDTDKQEIRQLINQFQFEEADEKLKKVKQKVGNSVKWIRDFERRITFSRV